MTRKMMTYGTLPTREEFEMAFDDKVDGAYESGMNRFRFANDPRVGTCALTASELWRELEDAQAYWEAQEPEHCECQDSYQDPDCPELAGQWCSDVLSVFGFEWV